MKRALATQLRKSVWAVSAAYLVNDSLWQWRLRAGLVDADAGATHSAFSPTASVEYVRAVFEDYRRYGGVSAFHGAAAELGPGDNAGVALMMRADGCDSVDLVDRYYGRRNSAHQQRIYDELALQLPRTKIWPGSRLDEQAIPGVRWRTGLAGEEFFRKAAADGTKYDFIVSRSVLEHLYDPLGCLSAMADTLSPTGKLIHKIDLRDHGMFGPIGNPLKFLEIPTFVYRRMTRYSGRPNRILFHRYRQLLDGLRRERKLNSKMYVTRLAGVGDIVPHVPLEDIASDLVSRAVAFVDAHRGRFAREFSDVASIDLAIQGMFLIAAP